MVFPEENSGDLLIPKKMVLISEMDMVAKGNDRAVFFHPRYPDILLKLLLDFSQINLVGFRGWSLKTFPSTRGRAIFKEYEATIWTHFNVQEKIGEIPISRLYGFVETDQGQASIVERIFCENETLGPNLKKLRDTKHFQKNHVSLLNDFVARILSWKINTTDMNIDNIVYGTNRGQPQFILVDGIGDNYAIPVRKWSRFVMQKSQSSSFNRIAQDLGIQWNSRKFCFKV